MRTQLKTEDMDQWHFKVVGRKSKKRADLAEHYFLVALLEWLTKPSFAQKIPEIRQSDQLLNPDLDTGALGQSELFCQ